MTRIRIIFFQCGSRIRIRIKIKWILRIAENVSTQKYDFERRLCTQTQELQVDKKFYMSQVNPKEFVNNTHIFHLPYIAGVSL